MDATLTSNLFIVLLVTAVISGLITEESKAPATAESSSFNTLITQQIFRQCGNSVESNSICIKLIDELVQGAITKDEFLNHIKHPGIEKRSSFKSPSNSL